MPNWPTPPWPQQGKQSQPNHPCPRTRLFSPQWLTCLLFAHQAGQAYACQWWHAGLVGMLVSKEHGPGKSLSARVQLSGVPAMQRLLQDPSEECKG